MKTKEEMNKQRTAILYGLAALSQGPEPEHWTLAFSGIKDGMTFDNHMMNLSKEKQYQFKEGFHFALSMFIEEHKDYLSEDERLDIVQNKLLSMVANQYRQRRGLEKITRPEANETW